MQIEEIITEVIIESEGASREDAAPPGAVPEIDAAEVVALVARVRERDDRREERLEVEK